MRSNTGPDPGGFWLWEPTTGPGNEAPAAVRPFPLVLYFSGCCGDATETYPTPEEVDPWLSHLARQGSVVAPVYHVGTPVQDSRVLLPLALKDLATPGHAGIDPDQTAAIGYSYGGVIAILYIAQAAAAGLPAPRALFLTAPCVGQGCLDLPDAPPALPQGMTALILASAHDSIVRDDPLLVWAAHETTSTDVDAADWYGI